MSVANSEVLIFDSQLLKERDYWRDKLSGITAASSLLPDYGAAQDQFPRKSVIELEFPQSLIQDMEELTNSSPFLIYTAFLAGAKICLHRYSEGKTIIVGSPALKELGRANSLAIVTEIDTEMTFRQLLVNLRETLLEAYEKQSYPFDYVMRDLGVQDLNGHCAFFDLVVTLKDLHGDLPELSNGLTITIDREKDGLSGFIEFNPARYTRETVVVFTNHLVAVLEAALKNRDKRLGDLEMATAAERQRLLVSWNQTAAEYPADRTLHELFEAQVERTPHAVALVCDDLQLTYAELNSQANQLAHYLMKLGVGPEQLVGVCMERSLEMMVALLGILKAGGAYVPIDPANPRERVSFMLEDTLVRVLLTQERLLTDLPELNCTSLCLDSDWNLFDGQSQINPPGGATPDNLAYVIYTSGSTGQPKGVMIPHRGLVNYLNWCTNTYLVAEGCGAMLHSSISFDLTITSLFAPLLAGNCVFLLPEGIEALAGALVEKSNHSLLKLTPTHLKALAALLPAEQLAGCVRVLVIGGEALQMETLEFWRAHAPATRLINEYGPTETTVGCCVYEVSAGDVTSGSVSIGGAIANTEVYVLDQDFEPVPIGVAGELYIGGVGLARGYWQRAELTAERFVPHPFTAAPGSRLYRTGDVARYRADGHMDFLGRMDHQVKVRGFRIELGEIETVLRQHPGVQNAVVMIREDWPDDKRLVAYLVPGELPSPSVNELLDFLRLKLPEFMMPQAFVTLEQLPLSRSGKIDRRMLPAPDHGRPDLGGAFIEPAGEAEQTLARIWKEVLRVERIGAHDNFFALGGESILAMQVVARANQAGLSLQFKHLFEHQTIAELALVAGTAPTVEAEQGQVSGPVPITPIQHWFFEQNWSEPHHYNQSVMLETEERLNVALLKAVFDELLRHHDALRLRYSKNAGEWQQFNSGFSEGAAIQYFDLSTLPQDELSTAIEQHADSLQASLNLTTGPLLRIALFDCGPRNPSRLLLVAHHLAVDGVSWRIILNDLQTGYGQALLEEPISFGPKTTSFKYWAEQLVDYSRAGRLDAENPYWLKFAGMTAPSLPVDHERGVNTVEWARRVNVSLDANETRALLQEVPAAYNTQINDVLLTAVLQAFQEWTGERSLLITLEGHGREDIVENVDLSRTVGWLTTVYPVFMTLEDGQSEGESLCLVKEQLRAIPQRGIGYGLLRYLSEDDETRSQLGQLVQPEISFNYLGQFDQVLSESSLFRVARESRGQTQSRRGNLPHLLQINGSVTAGSLQLVLTYSEKIFRHTTIERFGASLKRALRALIAHCRSPEAGGFTPSDFPLATLTQSELDLVAGSDKQVEDIYPLSPFQQGLLFHMLFAPESDVYFTQLSGTIDQQQLNVDGLKRAWQRVVDRHPVLRTAFIWEGVSGPLQVVRKKVALPWQELDWRGLSDSEQSAQLDAFLKADQKRGFAFAAAPLMRCSLVRLGEDTYRFIWSYHHVLLDGWAVMHVAKEVFDSYEAFAEGREPSLAGGRPFKDYIAWLQKQDQSKAERFWRTALAGFTSPTSLEVERPATGSAEKEENYFDQRWKLSARTTEALKALARKHHLTLNTIVQGIYGLLLSRYSGDKDVVFGATVAGRPAALAGVESMVGIFINTLPVRVRIEDQDKLLPWLKRLQEHQVEAQQYEYTPLVDVQGWSDVPRGRPLFESILLFENYPVDASLSQRREGLMLSDVSSIDRANYSLAIGASPGRQLHFRFSYDRGRFADETITRMFGHLETLLEAIVADPERRLADLPLLTQREREQVLVEWNQTAVPYPVPQCLHELFEDQVRRLPQTVALHTPEEQLSYAELNQRANQLAHFLRQQGVGPEVLVGICMERSAEMVVSMLAVLKAGGAYVPLDPEYPLERLRYMMDEINAWVVLTQGRLSERLPAHWGQVISVDDEWESFTSFPDGNPVSGVNGDNLANLIFTSGSTGTPKASMVTHRGLCNTILHRAKALSLTDEDRFLQTNSFSFDASVWEFFAPLAIGGQLIMLRPGGYKDPSYIVSMLAEHQITTVEFPPSWLQMVLLEHGLANCEHLKHVVCGGQILTGELQERFHNRLQADLHNYYGPSEASIDATSWTCRRGVVPRTVPIGRPITNVQVYLLDANLRLVPAGVPGELHIAGEGLARGYLNRASLTAEKFIPNPFAEKPGSRLYQTGDVARYLPDGAIEFCGRNDDQVKIRGFRIELGEVEAVLAQHEQVSDAAVIAREDTPGDKRLVAYLVATSGPTVDEFRGYMKEKLPDHMVPALFVMLEKLPRNLNGKVDREALPMPDLSRPQLETPFVAPRNSVEENLAEIWVEVLGVQQVGIDDSFFALGGDSIRSVQVLSKAQQRGLSFSLQSIFQHPTIRRLAEEVTVTMTAGEAALQTSPFSLISAEDRERLPVDVEDAYPLSMLQAGMIFHTEYHPDSAVYHSISSRRIKAKLDLQALETAVERIVEQHPVLRTSFHLHGFSEPLQLVHRRIRVPVTEDDLRYLEPVRQDEVVTEWLKIEKLRPFEWTQAPLLRLHVHRYTDETFQFTFTAHHSMLDGWSDSIVFAELFKRYVGLLKGEAEPETVPPSIPYREFVWLERQAMESEATRSFWSEQLRDSIAGVLPRWTTTDGDRSAARLYRVVIPVSGAVSDGLKQITQTTGVPIKDVLLAAHLKVMSLLAGQPDVITGLVSNGRPEATDGDRIAGLFLNTLPFRMKLPKGSWLDLINKVFATENEILPHRRYPLVRIQRDQGGESLFETAFSFTQFHLYQGLVDIPEVRVLDSISVAETNFTLLIHFALGIGTNQIQATLDCNATELDEDQIMAIGGYYARALEAMAANPQQNHDSIALLAEEERRQLLSDWDSTAEYPDDRTLSELFEERVASTPDAVALVFGDERISYREVNQRANQLAHYLMKLGVGPETLVGICVERSAEMVVGMLGIVKAGGAYLPLDPVNPKERLAFMIEDAQLGVILAQEKILARLPEESGEIVCLDRDWELISREQSTNPEARATAENTVYVIYTSGSTGKPKGVSITRQNVLRLFQSTEAYFNFDEQDVWTMFHSYAFDFSVWEMWGTLLYGGKLVIVPYWVSRSPEAFYQLLEAERVTVLNQTPSAFRQLVEVDGREGRELSLRLVIFGGEALDLNSLRPWFERHGEERPQLVNMYGITETTVHVTYRPLRLSDLGGPGVIGDGLPDLKVCVLDQQLHLVPEGVAGELYVGGAGLGRGYLNRPQLTAERFIPDPFSMLKGVRLYKTGDVARLLPNGDFEYLGRADEQVKIRGFRVELGEIETVLNQHAAVREAAVVRQDGVEPRLVAYVVSADTELPTAELRLYIKDRLPDYMVPSALVLLEHLPLTPNGKVDRRALSALKVEGAARDEYSTGSRLPVEDMLAGIWSEVLGIEQVEVHDNFFELGGHSLLATQVVSRVRNEFKMEVALRSLFEAPTLSGFAAVVQSAMRDKQGLSAPPIKPVSREIELPLSFAQQRLWIAEELVKGSAVYHLPAAVRLKGQLNIAALERSLNELIRRHETLRTSFTLVNGGPLQIIAPSLKLPLPLVDLSELPEASREAEARRLTNDFIMESFDLSTGPLLRAKLIRVDAHEHIALFVMHHIISDGWSMGVLVREIAALYDAFIEERASPLSELPVHYADFAVWQREWLQGEVLELQLDYWRRQLGPHPPELLLPIDRPRPPVQTHNGARLTFSITPEVQRGLAALSRREGVTMFMTLLAGFQTLLYRYSSQEDIIVGTDMANRNRAETENVIGFFVNMLVLRTDLSGNPTFLELLGRVREMALGAYAHQDLPFERLVDELELDRDPSRNPLFQAVFVLQNTPSNELKLPGINLSPFSIESNSVQFDLILSLSESRDGIAGVMAYNTDLFDQETISRMVSRYQTLLHVIAEDPSQRIADFHLISDTAANGLTPTDFPKASLSQKDFESLLAQLGTTSESVS